MVVSRVTLTTSPSLDLEDVIAEKEIQWQDIPSNKTYETSPTSNTIAEDMCMNETCQRTDAHEMDGNTAASQHRMRKQVPYKVYKKEQETFTVQATHGPTLIEPTNHSVDHGTLAVRDTTVLKTSVESYQFGTKTQKDSRSREVTASMSLWTG